MEKKTVLMVDDEVDLINLITIRLEFYNYYVVPCYVAEKAFEAIRKQKPDLILLDVMMPGIDGYTLCKRIKADNELKSIPVIIFTAKQDVAKTLQKKCLEAGADDFILKPFKPEDLLAKIEKLI